MTSTAMFAAVQGKNRSILFYLQSSDRALAYGVSSAYAAESNDTKYKIDTVKLPPATRIYPLASSISAVSWETDDGKEEIRVYYATPGSDKPRLAEIGMSDGGPWYNTKTFDSNAPKLHTMSPISASRGSSTDIIKVYFWRPSGIPAVCWSAVPNTQAARIHGLGWKDQDFKTSVASIKL